MGRTLGSANKGGNSTPAPEGNHIGICVGVVFLGTHTKMTQWGEKTNELIRISFELPEEKHVFSPEKGEECYMAGQEYTFSMGENARLRKDLEAWRNKAFTEEEMAVFDVQKLLGQPAMVQITHKVSKKGSTYAALDAITAVPKSIKANIPKPENKLVYYDLDQGQGSTFQDLPKFLQEKIQASAEFKTQGKQSDGQAAKEAPEDIDLEAELGPKSAEDESVPF